MVTFCLRFCPVCRRDRSSGKNRDAAHQFHHCYSAADDHCTAVFLADGTADRGILRNRFHIGKTLVFLLLSGCATGASWLCYFKALQLGDVSQVAPIDKSSTILTMLLAFLLLGESLTWLKLCCMLLIGAGTFLMLPKHSGDLKTVSSKKGWLFYAVLSAVFASLTSILGKVGIQDIDSNLGTAIRTCVVLVMAWVMVFVTGQQHSMHGLNRKDLLFLGLSGLTTGLSWLCYYRALQDGPASVVVPIDKLSILVTVAFSGLVLKERLDRRSGTGLVLLTAGTLLLVL